MSQVRQFTGLEKRRTIVKYSFLGHTKWQWSWKCTYFYWHHTLNGSGKGEHRGFHSQCRDNPTIQPDLIRWKVLGDESRLGGGAGGSGALIVFQFVSSSRNGKEDNKNKNNNNKTMATKRTTMRNIKWCWWWKIWQPFPICLRLQRPASLHQDAKPPRRSCPAPPGKLLSYKRPDFFKRFHHLGHSLRGNGEVRKVSFGSGMVGISRLSGKGCKQTGRTGSPALFQGKRVQWNLVRVPNSSQWTMSCRSSSYTARFLECSKNQKYQKIKFITLTYY